MCGRARQRRELAATATEPSVLSTNAMHRLHTAAGPEGRKAARGRGARQGSSPAGSQGALGSTKRQRFRSGQSSCFGRWAWQMSRPCRIRFTWASYIWSGWSIARK